MEINEEIAEVVYNPENKKVKKIIWYQNDLRFKCMQCGVFCCKLGGPRLTKNDVERLEHAGYKSKDFFKTTVNSNFKGSPIMVGRMKNGKDGSCILLSYNSNIETCKCSVYDLRPVLCRLYPFDFRRKNPNTLILKLNPCCNGINNSSEEVVNERFVSRYILDSMLEILGG